MANVYPVKLASVKVTVISSYEKKLMNQFHVVSEELISSVA